MVYRDPETGQYRADNGHFDDIEVASFQASVGVEASSLSGGTGFTGEDSGEIQGLELIDYDDIVDRDEQLHLLRASHRLSAYANSTETEDGAIRAYAEIAAQPSFVLPNASSLVTTVPDGDTENGLVGRSDSDDSIDMLGRPLVAMAGAPFSDTSTGIGGAGTQGDDKYDSDTFPSEHGRFHPRDETFANVSLEAWNIDDAGIHVDLSGQHVYGVMSDC